MVEISEQELTRILNNVNGVSGNAIDYLFDRVKDWRITWGLLQRMIKAMNQCRDRRNKIGRIGEIYASYSIKWNLHQHGFTESRRTKPNTYSLVTQYRRKGKNKGIDIYVRLTDKNNITSRFLIEVSNWMKMHDINDYIFSDRILSKFKKYDKGNKNIRVLLINHRNIQLIIDRCRENNIKVIGVNEHITPDLISRLIEKDEIIEDIDYW